MDQYHPLAIAYNARQVTRGNPALLASLQLKRLNSLVTFARANSPFYAEKYRRLPNTIRDVREIPSVTKQELMEHFDQVVTDKAVCEKDVREYVSNLANIGKPYLGKYMVWTTSGTTGIPGIFLEDKKWDAVITTVNVLRIGGEWYTWDVIKGMLKAGGNSASIFAGNGHFLGVTMLERQRSTNRSRAKRIQLIPVTLPITEITKRLNDLQPAMLSGYASALGLLAQEQMEGRLNIHPSIIISSAEPLSDENRSLIQEAFGVPARNNYGCSEGGVMGYECKQGNMHINADWIIFEPTNNNHEPIGANQLSDRTLITNLANHVMPIIRYELGDRVSLSSESCSCGITLPVAKVEGRTDEILRFATTGDEIVPIIPLALWSVIKETPGILRFQAIQTANDALKIRFEGKLNYERASAWEILKFRVNEYLASQNLANVKIIEDTELPMRDPKSGKFRNIWIEKNT